MAIRVWSGETSWCEVGLSGPCASQVKHKKDRIAHDLHNMLCQGNVCFREAILGSEHRSECSCSSVRGSLWPCGRVWRSQGEGTGKGLFGGAR